MKIGTKHIIALSFLLLAAASVAQAQNVFSGRTVISALPESKGDAYHYYLIWKDSNDYAKSAELAYSNGRFEEAGKLCGKSINAAPLTPDGKSHQSNERAVRTLAMLYIRQKKYADAINLYDDLFAANPNTSYGDNLLSLNLAYCYLRLGNNEKALQYYQYYKKHYCEAPDPKDPSAPDYPGTDTPTKLAASILMYRGAYMAVWSNKDEGLDQLREAHKLLPDNPIIADWLVNDLSPKNDRVEMLGLYKIIVKYSHDKSEVDDAKYWIPLYEYSIAHEK